MSVRITVVNHADVEIACPPASVWRDMLEAFVHGASLDRQGYRTAPLMEDPAALLGGYRVSLQDAQGQSTDVLIVRITERDDDAMRLGLWVEYLEPAVLAQVVHTGCQAVVVACGTRYYTYTHSTFNVNPSARDDVAGAAAAFKRTTAASLDERLAAMKARLEKLA